ncbi:MAG: sulfite oxidase [Hyphomicrobiaceae bacterium]|nr:MAG: sulfite oxidase [Hyphomicrobiaceae bacterium]
MTTSHPFREAERRAHTEGPFDPEEVRLANRNSGLLLEALRHDVTPAGLHYLLNHFDVPYVADGTWQVDIAGRVKRRAVLSLDEIKKLPARTLPVTLECAGNGRAAMMPRYQSMPWLYEAVGTAEWTGTPLRHALDQAGLLDDAIEISFIGADRGFDRGHEHSYGRSLRRDVALSDDVLLVWAMNGQPLLPQHGYPLRLVVAGWYGMASVKWLARIEALDKPYDGFQQVNTYMYRADANATPVPVSHIRVKSLMVPPGIPDWYTRHRLVAAGPTPLFGRAWSGGGVPIARVEVGIDGVWHDAELDPPQGKFAWRGWRSQWNAEPGEHVLSCRATDADGETQPLEARWDMGGFGNNVVQCVHATVR